MGQRTPVQRLTEEQQAFIVCRCAEFATPSQVSAELFERWGIKWPRQRIEHYDPTKMRAKKGKLAKKWVALFWSHRERYLAGQSQTVELEREKTKESTEQPAIQSDRSRIVLEEVRNALDRVLLRWPAA